VVRGREVSGGERREVERRGGKRSVGERCVISSAGAPSLSLQMDTIDSSGRFFDCSVSFYFISLNSV
jgi:hypothetical protein